MHSRFGFLCGVVFLLAGPVWAADPPQKVTPEQATFFEKQIRPVLATRCFTCHGPKVQKSGLRLDSRAAVLKGSEAGPVARPGKPGESKLILAIGQGGRIKMPPKGKLKPDEIAALTKWVTMGLPWPAQIPKTGAAEHTHWAFQPVRNPAVPHVQNDDWSRTPVDRFVLARLHAAGLTPSQRADRRTLIRRATFDLTGLPPTPEEVTAFFADDDPNAFAKLIDRLLASPAYGERWARHWLDVARYADNKGYVFFEEKNFPWAYTYRDYVISALNEDLPYDRFIVEQLAADQLELREDKTPLTAMGFLTLGARFMNNVHDVYDDRIDVVTRGLLGLTVTCARCHAHKYDPIPMEDYYSLYGVFRSSSEPVMPPLFARPPETDTYRKFDGEMRKREQALNDFVSRKHEELVNSSRDRAVEYLMAAYAKRNQPPTEDFMLLVFAGELNPTMIQRWQTYLFDTREQHDPVWSIWHAYADLPENQFAQNAAGIMGQFLETDKAKPVNPLIRAAFAGQPAASMQAVADRYVNVLKPVHDLWQLALRESVARDTFPEQLPDPQQEELRRVFYGRAAPPDVPLVLGWGFLALLPDRPAQEEYKKLIHDVETWRATGPGAPPRAMTLLDNRRPFEPYIFLRGNPNRKGPAVPRQFLELLSGADRKPFSHGSGRLELARAIADPRNPLTARVFVNRVWMQHFGTPLVSTPSDFGVRSDPPSHPELLDFLAAQFMSSGWSLKQLHGTIMRSAVYQQLSHDRPDCLKGDPSNRLLWKMNRRRLDFEAMRDTLIAVSGSMDRKMGGPPANLFAAPVVARRTIYGFVNRMDLPGLYRAFDFPEPAASSPGRQITTIAPQALFLMNNAFAVEVARRITQRPDVTSLQETDARVAQITRILFSRAPTTAELTAAKSFLGEKPPPEMWTQYVQALLMTNELVFVD